MNTFYNFLTTDQRWHPSRSLLPIQSPKNCSRPGYPHLVVMYREPLAPSGWQVNDHWEQNIKVVVGADLKQLTCNSESVLNMPDFWQTFSSVQVRPLRYISAGHWCGWGSEALWGRKTEQVITVFVSTLIWLNLTRLPSKTLAVLLISKDVDMACMTCAMTTKLRIESSIRCRFVIEAYSTLKLLCCLRRQRTFIRQASCGTWNPEQGRDPESRIHTGIYLNFIKFWAMGSNPGEFDQITFRYFWHQIWVIFFKCSGK